MAVYLYSENIVLVKIAWEKIGLFESCAKNRCFYLRKYKFY